MRLSRTLWSLAAGIILAAVTAVTAPAVMASPGEATVGSEGCCDVVVADQARDQILVLDARKRIWDAGPDSRAVKWAWRPTLEEGFDGLVDNWGLPDEAKLRHFRGKTYLLTTDSYGLAAMVPYPSGDGSYWAADGHDAIRPAHAVGP